MMLLINLLIGSNIFTTVLTLVIDITAFLVAIRYIMVFHASWAQATKAYFTILGSNVLLGFPVFLLVVLFRFFLVAPFQMNGQAMIPTLKHGEYIMVNKLNPSYERGDIAVFEPPLAERYYYVERIVGLPGETIIFDGTKVIIKNAENPEGFMLNEPYVHCPPGGCSYFNMSKTQFDIPEGSYFVMGDNRMNSTDSRFCFSTCSNPDATPFLPMENMVGKVMGVIWPFEVSKMIEAPEYLTVPATP